MPKSLVTHKWQPALSDCWAKTDSASGLPALTVRDHCLIVGYVGAAVAEHLPESLRAIFPPGFLSLIAAHDIGKLTPGFQLKCPLWNHYEAVSHNVHRNGLETNHAAVSQSHLQFSNVQPASRLSNLWFISTAGHHGSYPNGFNRGTEPSYEGGNQSFTPLRDELLQIIIDTFGPLPTESAKNELQRVHLLTGLTIFSDWIGSNSDWFPFDFPIDRDAIKDTASKILSQLGLASRPTPNLSFGSQFGANLTPRPIQSELVAAANAPGLYIVEAPMGMGKTEAALAAAYRRWTEGTERGLYFALPTQLTSERIHDRINSFLGNVVAEQSTQSLIHGNAWLHKSRNRQLAPLIDDAEHNDTEESLRWFSSTRRQLLAPFGTGTIDQALLAVLPARFAALRYFALAGKVVVIDEVHSYDPYMSALIDRLICYLLKTGSTVIILSATLTAARRAELVTAAGATENESTAAYPLITKVASGNSHAQHITIPGDLPSKDTHLIHQTLTSETETAYWQSIADSVEAGANVVVIRNTVALAQETFRHIKSLISDKTETDHCGLIHSRYPQWQRSENEAAWVARLGKDDTIRPHGSLLVSTQIVEQSVDIDSDLLVTDLAPTDLILQRIGRLHRHDRARPAGFEKASCHILHPPTNWIGETTEVEQALAPHHFIYPPLKLWQASQYLRSKTSISIPGEIRDILEDSAALKPDNSSSKSIHQFLKKAEEDFTTQVRTAATRDVFSASAIDDNEGTETRYNIQPTAHLILLKERPLETATTITITPLHGTPITFQKSYFSFELAKALHLNAIRIPAYLVREPLKAPPDWLAQHIDGSALAILSGFSLEILPENSTNYLLEFTSTLGLTHSKIEAEKFTSEPEDFWF